MLYGMYAEPEDLPLEVQIEKMTEDFNEAEAKEEKLPPGFHAHMGYLYFQSGQLDEARAAFETEKALFPESTTLMDRFIDNLGK